MRSFSDADVVSYMLMGITVGDHLPMLSGVVGF